jgi:hypothetical protein
MSGRSHESGQLGFEALLSAAEEDNRRRRFERETAHLPGRMDEALPFYRELIRRHDRAMKAAAVDETMGLREEAHKLALRLNDGEPGILAGPDAPGNLLARETAAPSGAVPLWGQEGAFVITAGSMQVRIEIDGMFGIGCSSGFWPGFSAHAVEADRPFLSETGYRSFLGIYAEPVPDLTPEDFAQKVIEDYVARSLKGRLVAIGDEYRSRFAGGGGS